MTQPRAYIETTIPSFYFETRSQPSIVARKEWTRQWWDGKASLCERLTSTAVLDELGRGPSDRVQDWLKLVESLPVLGVNTEIAEIVAAYIQHKVMPNDPAGDALHLAVASYYKCDFLVTWNCLHLANANKFGHIRRINTILGIFVPAIVTPLELLGG